MRTAVAFPVRDQAHFTKDLLGDLRSESFERAWVLDNGSTDSTAVLVDTWPDPRISRLYRPDARIYDLWNEAFALSKEAGIDVLVLLNNDLRLHAGTVAHLAHFLGRTPEAWIVSPDPARRVADGLGSLKPRRAYGTFRHGGICGFAFAAAIGRDWPDPPIDPVFEWWYGDDDLVFSALERGGMAFRIEGLPVDHVGEGTARLDPTRAEKIQRDEDRFVAKWGNR